MRSRILFHAWVSNKLLSLIVWYISRNRDMGMVKLKISASTYGRAEGSNKPKKVRLPFLQFSTTVRVTIAEHPEPKVDVTASF